MVTNPAIIDNDNEIDIIDLWNSLRENDDASSIQHTQRSPVSIIDVAHANSTRYDEYDSAPEFDFLAYLNGADVDYVPLAMTATTAEDIGTACGRADATPTYTEIGGRDHTDNSRDGFSFARTRH